MNRCAQRSFRWLCQEYKRRVRLSPKILARRSSVLDEICNSEHKSGSKRGTLPFDLLERKHVLEIRDDLRSTPGAQNEVVKVISAMYGWAIENEIVRSNPALGIKRLKSGDGFHTWSVAEVRQFEARHPPGSKARLALHLGLFTGPASPGSCHPWAPARQEWMATHPSPEDQQIVGCRGGASHSSSVEGDNRRQCLR